MKKTIKTETRTILRPVTETVEIETFELSRVEMEVIHKIVAHCNIRDTIESAARYGEKLSPSDFTIAHRRIKEII